MPKDPSSTETTEIRKRLLSVAIPYAESLKERPGLNGILLYGSLVTDRLTPFSDIDLAIFYDGEPACRIEHRVVSGEKLDLIAFPLEDVTKLLQPLPRSLDVGFPFKFVLESLLLAEDDSILYDPTGELRRVKKRLLEAVSYSDLNRVSLSDGYHHFYRVNAEEARSLLEAGKFQEALDKAKWCGFALSLLIREHTGQKDVWKAAEQAGIPEFAAKREELASLSAPSNDAAEAVWTATQALWDHALDAMGPLKEQLREEGVTDPDRLEFNGEYGLFWPGEYLSEFGRTINEVDYSMLRCRHDLDQGKGAEALQHLFGCRGAEGIRRRWEALDVAFKGTGYDCAAHIEPMLQSEAFTRLGERLDRAMEAAAPQQATPETAQRALSLVAEMEGMLVKIIPFMSLDELNAWKDLPEERKPDAPA